jgi:hypothetical protein
MLGHLHAGDGYIAVPNASVSAGVAILSEQFENVTRGGGTL